MASADRLLSLSSLCEMLALTPRALRFYEDKGLIVSLRDHNNWRCYDVANVRRLGIIAKLRRADVPLPEVKRVLELAEGEQSAAAARLLRKRLAAGEALRARINQDLAELRGLGRSPEA